MGTIREDELERLRSRIGQKITINEPPFLSEVTRDAIRHWAWATGDRNPLYLDETYAKSSRFQGLIMPPCMLYAFSRASIGYRGGLPGVHSMFGGSWFRFKRPAKIGDQIVPEITFKSLEEFPSRFAGRMFKQLSEIKFNTTDGREIATAEAWGMRVGRSEAVERGKYDELKHESPKYTKPMLADIADQYAREVCRGDKPLYFEDVDVGLDIPQIIRGPYSPTVAVAFEQAWGGLFIWAHGYWFEYLRRHPAAGIPNEMGVPEPPEAVHWDTPLARSVGVPQAYDYGPERISWLATMLTNWIGDHGFLSEIYCEMRRFNLIGDLTYGKARVMEKAKGTDGTGLVTLAIEARDQRDQLTAKGWAKVKLPTKG